jgi:hypothetical protein
VAQSVGRRRAGPCFALRCGPCPLPRRVYNPAINDSRLPLSC